ncbi:hypothetical protein O1611_g5274 [Lasiodiplodia mahajangana]|uniref:Uncharacterized protein n=1 Tax=Lasiodiplodia mahajangana TaxID=1108764 RepID=A0ACC2JLH7_9PEZI|nr:hypothetical protein O1611_g5274 [Lasiodiplodia mahajangana]
MSPQFQPWQSSEGLPVELIEMIVEELPTPAALLNFAGTSSLIHSIVFRNPSRLYIADARYQNRALDASKLTLRYPVTLPSLIHAIQNDSLDKIKTVLDIFQAETSPDLIDAWSMYTFPMPAEAAITAGRLDALILLIKSGCWLNVRDTSQAIWRIKGDYESSNDDLWSIALRHGVGGTLRNPEPYILACLEGQSDIAVWLLENIYAPHRFHLWVAVHTGLKEPLKCFPLSHLPFQDPLIPLALNFALSTDSMTGWVLDNVTRLKARGVTVQGTFDEVLKAMARKGLWDITANTLDLVTGRCIAASHEVAALAAATDEGLPVTAKFIAFLCRRGHFDRWDSLNTSGDRHPDHTEDTDQLEKLLLDVSRENQAFAPNTFKWIVSMKGNRAMKYLADIFDNNKSSELTNLLPWSSFQQHQGACGTPGCYSMHRSLEKAGELLGRALRAESWDSAFLLMRGGAHLYKISPGVKDFLLQRLATLEYPKGKLFAGHLASTLREPIHPVNATIFQSQQADHFLEKLLALFRLCLGDEEILSHLAKKGLANP